MPDTPSWPPIDACEAVSPDDAYPAGSSGMSIAQDTPDTQAADTGKPVVVPVGPVGSPN